VTFKHVLTDYGKAPDPKNTKYQAS